MIGIEDDASRCLLSPGEFSNATTENVIKVFEDTESYARLFNGYILAVNSDRGTQFYANKRNKGICQADWALPGFERYQTHPLQKKQSSDKWKDRALVSNMEGIDLDLNLYRSLWIGTTFTWCSTIGMG